MMSAAYDQSRTASRSPSVSFVARPSFIWAAARVTFRDERFEPALGLVVVEDAAAHEQPVVRAHQSGQPVGGELGDRVGVLRPGGRVLVLGALIDGSEHCGGACEEDASMRRLITDRFEERGGRGRDRLKRMRGASPRGGEEGRRGEMVELIGPVIDDGGGQRLGLQQVAVYERDPVAQMLRAAEPIIRRLSREPEDVVALLQQQLGHIGAVLAGDPGDQGGAGERHAAQLIGRPRVAICVWGGLSGSRGGVFMPPI